MESEGEACGDDDIDEEEEEEEDDDDEEVDNDGNEEDEELLVSFTHYVQGVMTVNETYVIMCIRKPTTIIGYIQDGLMDTLAAFDEEPAAATATAARGKSAKKQGKKPTTVNA